MAEREPEKLMICHASSEGELLKNIWMQWSDKKAQFFFIKIILKTYTEFLSSGIRIKTATITKATKIILIKLVLANLPMSLKIDILTECIRYSDIFITLWTQKQNGFYFSFTKHIPTFLFDACKFQKCRDMKKVSHDLTKQNGGKVSTYLQDY